MHSQKDYDTWCTQVLSDCWLEGGFLNDISSDCLCSVCLDADRPNGTGDEIMDCAAEGLVLPRTTGPSTSDAEHWHRSGIRKRAGVQKGGLGGCLDGGSSAVVIGF